LGGAGAAGAETGAGKGWAGAAGLTAGDDMPWRCISRSLDWSKIRVTSLGPAGTLGMGASE
jgi:hypothetical protein